MFPAHIPPSLCGSSEPCCRETPGADSLDSQGCGLAGLK